MKKKKFNLTTLAIILLTISCFGNLILASSELGTGVSDFHIVMRILNALSDTVLVAVLATTERKFGE